MKESDDGFNELPNETLRPASRNFKARQRAGQSVKNSNIKTSVNRAFSHQRTLVASEADFNMGEKKESTGAKSGE
ncbi:hypothetical protein TNCV_1824211 [Trichonephila clavipes]|nr:hypothetical protein TNCV_1824211 [Trichonephila clavipes]